MAQEENKKLKQKQKDKMQPKMGKLDIDYQVLHDAFFKHQNKPNFSIMGDVYYEGKEFEARVRNTLLHLVDAPHIPCRPVLGYHFATCYPAEKDALHSLEDYH